jgi:hypothetical protein
VLVLVVRVEKPKKIKEKKMNTKNSKIESILDEKGNFISGLTFQILEEKGFELIHETCHENNDYRVYIYEASDGVMIGLTNADPLNHDECIEYLDSIKE